MSEIFYTEDVLRLIKVEGYTAESLLKEKMPQAKRRWNHICKLMDNYMRDVQEVFPEAGYYTAGGGFNLCIGHEHDENGDVIHETSALGSDVLIWDGDY